MLALAIATIPTLIFIIGILAVDCILLHSEKILTCAIFIRLSLSKSKPLELVEQFIYLGSNISSPESDVNFNIGKA